MEGATLYLGEATWGLRPARCSALVKREGGAEKRRCRVEEAICGPEVERRNSWAVLVASLFPLLVPSGALGILEPGGGHVLVRLLAGQPHIP